MTKSMKWDLKTLDINQATKNSDSWEETNEVSPMIASAYYIESFQDIAQKGKLMQSQAAFQ